MVDTEYIRLMAQAAAYESEQFREDAFAQRYYKQDYVDKQRLRGCVWATIFFLIYWGYKAVDIFYLKNADLLHYDYTGLVIQILVEYLILLVIVSLITGIIHSRRFDSAKKRMDTYYDLLDQIDTFA